LNQTRNHTFDLTRSEAIVLFDWLAREVGERRASNLTSALVHVSEFLALNALSGALEKVLAEPLGPGWRASLAAARAALTPAETSLDIVPEGSEKDPSPSPVANSSGERGLSATSVVLPAADTLVLFEFLCREIDERDGVNLLRSFVSPAEFWALNAVQNMLEPGAFYAVARDYREQLREARTLVAGDQKARFPGIEIEGRES
jgi:hypothetical protein